MNKHELTNENYFENDKYMSVSKWKGFNKCEVLGLAPFGEPSDAMLLGSYVDAYVEGTLEDFKATHPEMIASQGKNKGALKAVYKQTQEICDYIDNNKVVQQFLSGEKQTIMVGEIAGVPFKIKMDSYSKGIAITDLKILKTITDKNGEYYDFVIPYGYDVQLACYQEIVYQNTGEKLPCFLLPVTKESPINSAVINLPQEMLNSALYRVESTIARMYEVKMKKEEPVPCGKCKICIENRTETPIISFYDISN